MPKHIKTLASAALIVFILYKLFDFKDSMLESVIDPKNINWKKQGGVYAPLLNAEKKVTYADDTELWQYLIHKDGECTIFLRSSVFYDDRPDIPGTPCLRLYVLQSTSVPEEVWNHLRFTLVSDTSDTPNAAYSNTSEFGAPNLLAYGLRYRQRLISISIRTPYETYQTPRYVTCSCDLEGLDPYPTNLTVERAVTGRSADFIVVTKPLFGYISDDDVPEVTEWLELNRMFGVKEFHLYNSSLRLSSRAQTLFQYYKGEGVLYVHQYHSVLQYKTNSREEYIASEILGRAALAEALLLFYKRVDYMVIIDMDEVIVPRQHATYQDLLTSLASHSSLIPNASSLRFNSVGFHLDRKPDETQPAVLKTLRFRHRTLKLRCIDILSKSMTRPRYCVLSNPHVCLWGCAYSCEQPVSQSLGLNHHYRYRDKYETRYRDKDIQDDYLLSRKEQILSRVLRVLGNIGYNATSLTK